VTSSRALKEAADGGEGEEEVEEAEEAAEEEEEEMGEAGAAAAAAGPRNSAKCTSPESTSAAAGRASASSASSLALLTGKWPHDSTSGLLVRSCTDETIRCTWEGCCGVVRGVERLPTRKSACACALQLAT